MELKIIWIDFLTTETLKEDAEATIIKKIYRIDRLSALCASSASLWLFFIIVQKASNLFPKCSSLKTFHSDCSAKVSRCKTVRPLTIN